jgi:hypothetical protein
MTVLPVTLAAAAAAAILNIWLSIRIGTLRTALGISVGDGGNESLQRRMRAQLNYVENTAFVLVLIGAIELAGTGFERPVVIRREHWWSVRPRVCDGMHRSVAALRLGLPILVRIGDDPAYCPTVVTCIASPCRLRPLSPPIW